MTPIRISAICLVIALTLAGVYLSKGCDQQSINWPETLAMVRESFPEITQLETAELAAWLADPQRPPPVILDTREPEEYAVSHLAGAVQVSPGSDPAKTLADLPKGQPVVVYCSVGYRSSRFARKMERAGFTNVANLEGSIFLWANEGRPLEPGDRVHGYDSKWGQLLAPSLRTESGEE